MRRAHAHIVAVDLSEDKLAQARALGATHTVNAGSDDAKAQIRDITSGGVDYAFEFAGAIRALSSWPTTRHGAAA